MKAKEIQSGITGLLILAVIAWGYFNFNSASDSASAASTKTEEPSSAISTAAPASQASAAPTKENCQGEVMYADIYAKERDLEYSKDVADMSIAEQQNEHQIGEEEAISAMTAIDFVYAHPEISRDQIGSAMYQLCTARNASASD